MNIDEIEVSVAKLAQENGLELTDNAHNICAFRARADIPLSVCPCSRGDSERFCISPKCMDDINKFGKCHCNCFRKKGE